MLQTKQKSGNADHAHFLLRRLCDSGTNCSMVWKKSAMPLQAVLLLHRMNGIRHSYVLCSWFLLSPLPLPHHIHTACMNSQLNSLSYTMISYYLIFNARCEGHFASTCPLTTGLLGHHRWLHNQFLLLGLGKMKSNEPGTQKLGRIPVIQCVSRWGIQNTFWPSPDLEVGTVVERTLISAPAVPHCQVY